MILCVYKNNYLGIVSKSGILCKQFSGKKMFKDEQLTILKCGDVTLCAVFLRTLYCQYSFFLKKKSQSNQCHINKDSNVVTAKLKH